MKKEERFLEVLRWLHRKGTARKVMRDSHERGGTKKRGAAGASLTHSVRYTGMRACVLR